jgi:fructokinase
VEGRAGGAMLNSAVSLGRLGLEVSFIGDFAQDHIGKLTCDFLNSNGVDTALVTFYEHARSRIALAFLDEQNNAEYTFYKIGVEKPKVKFPRIEKNDIVLFGSWFAHKPELRASLHAFIADAGNRGALIIYDPNYRRAHLGMLPQVNHFISENIGLSHITKGSDEDFHFILNTCDVSKAHKYAESHGCKHFIYTANRNGVWIFNGQMTKKYPAMDIKPVSTVGAGDSFNAGLVYALAKRKVTPSDLKDLQEHDWDEIISTCIQFASEVCMSYDNYIPEEFAMRKNDEGENPA